MDAEAARQRLDKFVSQYLGMPGSPVAAQEVCIREGTAAVYIRLLEHDRRFVRIFSPLLSQVDESPELLRELNLINAQTNFARVFWRDGTVYAATEQLATTLDLDELVHACEVISAVANHHDNVLHSRFGGQLAFGETT